jgi:hypothetical protein
MNLKCMCVCLFDEVYKLAWSKSAGNNFKKYCTSRFCGSDLADDMSSRKSIFYVTLNTLVVWQSAGCCYRWSNMHPCAMPTKHNGDMCCQLLCRIVQFLAIFQNISSYVEKISVDFWHTLISKSLCTNYVLVVCLFYGGSSFPHRVPNLYFEESEYIFGTLLEETIQM